jgi:DNA-directed RNA polymerase subunit RPC12/RpoP
MAFPIEQECPQCGAPVELDETDHLILCPFCNVKNYLFARDSFRFLLPHRAPNRAIIYAPYMRFKGEVYLCKGASINHSIVDITHLGVANEQLPISLGIRPQAMKMKFVTPDAPGDFLRCTLNPSDVLTIVDKHMSIVSPGKASHRAYIGEAFSLIYLPLFVQDNRVCDAVINRPIANLANGEDIFSPAGDADPRRHITFMATICPQCGWNLDGERDSVVLTCSNCDTAWEASEGTFVQVEFGAVPGQGEDVRYLPFWKITARDEGMGINTYADFIRITKQPIVIQRGWNSEALSFWIPAFKIRPKVFLRLARQMTIFQKNFTMEQELPKKDLYPVTLPRNEAAQSLKVTLASAVMTKRKFFPLLPQVNFTITKSHVAYLPFRVMGHDMIQEHLKVSINKNTLKYGRYL